MRTVVMLCTSAAGGMAQVVESLRSGGLFATYPIRLLRTHDRGGVALRAGLFLRALGDFARMLLTSQVALVHAHVAMRGSFWRKSVFLLLARLFRTPTLVHLHGSQFEHFYERECGPLRRRLVREVLQGASAVIVLSEHWRRYIVRQVAPGARVVTVHNFVDLRRMQREIERTATPRSSGTILFLGEIGRRKGIYDLVRALPDIVRAIPHARLVAAGTGEIEEVRRCAREAGVEGHVELPGWVSGAEKSKLLAQAAVYVLPSYNEGLPVSVLEAMAAALPVVSTPVGGIPDVIRDGEDGFLVPPGSIGLLAQRIVELLSDDARRERMGEQARRRLGEQCSAEAALASLESLYRECGVPPRGTLPPQERTA